MITNSSSSALLAVLTILVLLAPTKATANDEDSAHGPDVVLRYDPVYDDLIPIEKKDLKVGNIYSHFSPRLNRRVWSYWQSNQSFWHAFGEGTTQEAWKFDVPATREEALDQLRETDPRLAARLDRTATPVRLRLGSDEKWDKAGTLEVISIYDIETLIRWERHNDRYVPVIRTHGMHWGIRDGNYLPIHVIR